MVVRIRLERGPVFRYEPGERRRLALALAGLLSPAALLAAVFACWRLAADLRWTGTFAISSGPFSHWQVWILTAVFLQGVARGLTRYGRGKHPIQ